jgi:tyrosyl-tRNA synthetase
VFVEGYETGSADEQLNPKKKIWEKLSVDLKTSSGCVAQWQGNNLLTAKGVVTCKKVAGAPIK